MLTVKQVGLIRDTAQRLADTNMAATNAFYAGLFEVAPGTRCLFPDDMFKQSEKLWNSIVTVVESADDLAEIEKDLEELGARHVDYGAKREHYGVVTEVLIETFSSLMGEEWSDAHHRAWKTALDVVCATMLEGAKQREV